MSDSRPTGPSRAALLGDAVRRAVPDVLVPAVVAARLYRRRRDPARLADARREMEHLVGGVASEEELARASRAYVDRDVWRSELRWHPRLISYQPVEGVAHLRDAHGRGRGVVISFLHHGHYEGATASVGHAYEPIDVLVSPEMLAPDAPAFLRQHVRAGTISGNVSVDATEGTGAILARLQAGRVLAIATDVPGRSPVTFLDKPRVGSSGAARLATAANSPVVAMSAHCDDGRLWLSLSEPVEPSDFATPEDLLGTLLDLQEPHVTAWPEGYHTPTMRWGEAPADEASAAS